MHVSNLGLAQWTNAGVLLELLSRGFFGDPSSVSLADRLHIATLRFRKWCRLHGIAQSQAFLTVGMLHIGPSSSAPELTLKAYHGRVFVAFLASCCQALLSSQGEGDDELVLLLAVSHTCTVAFENRGLSSVLDASTRGPSHRAQQPFFALLQSPGGSTQRQGFPCFPATPEATRIC